VVDRSPKLARAGIAAALFASAGRGSARFASAGFALTGPVGRGALVVALVAGFGLAGCGRKSGLDAPPLAAAGDQQAGTASGSAQAVGADGKPVAPATNKRHTIFDWLIN
jgi:predicted small lipoprotein YifL